MELRRGFSVCWYVDEGEIGRKGLLFRVKGHFVGENTAFGHFN